MGFFEKLKLNIPKDASEGSSNENSNFPRRKRGRPKKNVAAGAASTPQAEQPKRTRGRPKKYPTAESTATQEEKGMQWLRKNDESEGELTIDVYETSDELIVRSPVAGIKPEDLDISIENDMLLIHGKRLAPELEEDSNLILEECYWGPFSRRFVLPAEVDSGRIKASLEKGILVVRIPKIERRRKKRVEVEVVEEKEAPSAESEQ